MEGSRAGGRGRLGVILASLVAAAAVALGPQAPSAPALAFADVAHGWLGGRSGIYSTANGGRSWRRQTTHPGEALAVVDKTHAWAIVDRGRLLRTTDGRRWANLGVLRLDAISFADARRGFALERDGILLRTSDGGDSWRPVSGTPHAQALCFADPRAGWLAQGGTVYATANAGRSWRATRLKHTAQGLPLPQLGCRGTDVWAVLHEGAGAGTEGYEVWRSLDRGRSWRKVLASPWQRRLPAISNFSGPVAVLGRGAAVLAGSCAPCGGRGTITVVSTRDGGLSFTRTTFPGPAPQAVSFPDPAHGWLLAGGQVRRLR